MKSGVQRICWNSRHSLLGKYTVEAEGGLAFFLIPQKILEGQKCSES